MAWGILFTALNVFGMLVLLVASVRMEDSGAGVSLVDETGPVSSPQAQEIPAAEAPEFKKAA